MPAVNLNDTPLHLHEWAELDHITALERLAAQRETRKLTCADLDAADIRRQAREQHSAQLVAASVNVRLERRRAWPVRLWLRLARTARIAWLQWQISADEWWLAAAARDDVHGTLNLTMVRRELEELRCALGAAYGAPR